MESPERSEKCKEVFSLLSEYLNVELPPGACEEIESHIAGCAPCVEFAESLRRTVDLCHHYQPSELPKPLADDARRQLLAAYESMLGARKSGAAGQ